MMILKTFYIMDLLISCKFNNYIMHSRIKDLLKNKLILTTSISPPHSLFLNYQQLLLYDVIFFSYKNVNF